MSYDLPTLRLVRRLRESVMASGESVTEGIDPDRALSAYRSRLFQAGVPRISKHAERAVPEETVVPLARYEATVEIPEVTEARKDRFDEEVNASEDVGPDTRSQIPMEATQPSLADVQQSQADPEHPATLDRTCPICLEEADELVRFRGGFVCRDCSALLR